MSLPRWTTVLVSAPSEPASLDWQCAALSASCRIRLGDLDFVRLRTEHPRLGREYPPINRLTALREWLTLNPRARGGRVIVCDPDILFFRDVPYWPQKGEMFADAFDPAGTATLPDLPRIIRQLRLNFEPTDYQLAHTGVMVFWGEDLWRVSALAEQLVEEFREVHSRTWQSDMYAIYLAVAQCELSVKRVPIAAPLDWPVSPEPYSGIHYCQPIKFLGEVIWHKHMPLALECLRALDTDQISGPLEKKLIETIQQLGPVDFPS